MKKEQISTLIMIICLILGTICLLAGIITTEIQINKYEEIYDSNS